MQQNQTLPSVLRWTVPGRIIVFFLAATSIWCLLSEFYHVCNMRTFTFAILVPSTILLIFMALIDRAKGDRRLWRACIIGVVSGFIAACAYDTFRFPWVIGAIDHVGPWWLRLQLFKVFPRFGAMILAQPFTPATTDSQFTLAAHVVGWLYHFSNGMTFGIMYMAVIGDTTKRSWMWAIVMAVFLELAMLFTPYVGFFGLQMTALFVVVTLSAHTIFGIAMGLFCKWWENRWRIENTMQIPAVS